MSLPSRAYLLKHGNIVADTFINVGWVISAPAIIKCCYDAYNACLEQENRLKEGVTDHPIAYMLNEWKSFDHILLYDHIIPRITLDEYFIGKITKTEFEQRVVDGSYIKHLNEWYQSHFNDELFVRYSTKREEQDKIK